MALYVCRNINEGVSVIIDKLLSNKYPISIAYFINWIIAIRLTHFLKRFSFLWHKAGIFLCEIAQTNKIEKTDLTIMTEAAANFAVQSRCSLVLAVLVLPDFEAAKAFVGGPLKVS